MVASAAQVSPILTKCSTYGRDMGSHMRSVGMIIAMGLMWACAAIGGLARHMGINGVSACYQCPIIAIMSTSLGVFACGQWAG